MKTKLTIFAAALTALILACSDKSTDVELESPPFFEVLVVDTSNTPLPGIRIGSMNHSPYIAYEKTPIDPHKMTTAKFWLPVAAYVELKVLNYYKQQVCLVESGIVASGQYVEEWDGFDDDGLAARSGYYYFHLWASDVATGTTIIEYEKSFILDYAWNPDKTIIDTTDQNGRFVTSDTLIFPGLLGNPPPIVRTDVDGSIIDTVFNFYSDTVTVTLSDPAAPDKYILIEKKLNRLQNKFKLIWNPSDTQ